MNTQSFVKLVKTEARDFSIDWSQGSNSGVSNKTQKWIDQLSDDEKQMLKEVVTESIDNSLFRVFEILDGIKGDSESIELLIDNQKVAGSNCPQTHDIYAEEL